MTEVGVTDDSVTQDGETAPKPHEPSEITFAEQFYPARPRHLRPKARLRSSQVPTVEQLGEPIGSNPSYLPSLRPGGTLHDAHITARHPQSNSGASRSARTLHTSRGCGRSPCSTTPTSSRGSSWAAEACSRTPSPNPTPAQQSTQHPSGSPHTPSRSSASPAAHS